jgi:hypothetical protein
MVFPKKHYSLLPLSMISPPPIRYNVINATMFSKREKTKARKRKRDLATFISVDAAERNNDEISGANT